MQHEFGSTLIQKVADTAIVGGVVELKGAGDGGCRGCKVGKHACETNVVGLLGHSVEGKGVLDDLLY